MLDSTGRKNSSCPKRSCNGDLGKTVVAQSDKRWTAGQNI